MKARDALREVGSASRPVHSSALKKWRARHAAHIMRRQMGSVSCACVFVILVMLATNLPPSLVEAIPDQRLSASHCMRRTMLSWLVAPVMSLAGSFPSMASEVDLGYEKQEGLKPGLGKKRTRVPGFTALPSGLQVKDVNPGRNGTSEAKEGDFVVFTWEGYTINYFGRPFETQTLQKMAGVDPNPVRCQIGDGTVIKGIDEGLRGMREGGIRQVYIPVELSYDEEKRLGPRPTTAGGNRALDFVMDNKGGLMDKTLLINVAVKRVYQK